MQEILLILSKKSVGELGFRKSADENPLPRPLFCPHWRYASVSPCGREEEDCLPRGSAAKTGGEGTRHLEAYSLPVYVARLPA